MLINEEFKQKIEAVKIDYNKWLEEMAAKHNVNKESIQFLVRVIIEAEE